MKEKLDRLRGAYLEEVIDFLEKNNLSYDLEEIYPPEYSKENKLTGQGRRRFINALKTEDTSDTSLKNYNIYFCHEKYIKEK